MSANHIMDEYTSYNRRSLIETFMTTSPSIWVVTAIAIVYFLYNRFFHFDIFPINTVFNFAWGVFVYVTPAKLVITLDHWRNPDMYDVDKPEDQPGDMYAFKSEALRRVFGFEAVALKQIPGASSLRRASWLGSATSTKSDAPPGLGNWDNSCYQNSVLQGLSALRSLTAYLENSDVISQQDSSSTMGSLRETITKLNDASNNGRRIWTPAKLKSMSSWQQQDAQEYFSKIMDDVEKETAKATLAKIPSQGLKEVQELEASEGTSVPGQNTTEPVSAATDSPPAKPAQTPKTPLDGYLAQRVACLKCGFSEGLSMIPFNCLTVPLGNNYSYDLSQCLDSYTNLEEISGVECAKCTLLHQKAQLENMLKPKPNQAGSPGDSTTSDSVIATASDFMQIVATRLETVQQALDDSDFSDATLNKRCQIPKKARVSTSKTRQAVIARAPTGLVIHVNRSMFDEYSGDMRKNTASVNYPKVLDLGPWCLGTKSAADSGKEEWNMDPAKSMIVGSGGKGDAASQYILRSAVCHYGRHENGHYICYREHPEVQEQGEEGAQKMKWWRLSDDDVSSVTEEQVLAQGGVFMLFYERLEAPILPEKPAAAEAQIETEAVVPKDVDQPTKIMPAPDMDHDPKDAIMPDAVQEPSIIQGIKSGLVPEVSTPTIVDTAPTTIIGVKPEGEACVEVEQSPSSSASAESPPSPVEPQVTPQPPTIDIRNTSAPPAMRTARRGSKKSRGAFDPTMRAMAAT